MTKVEDWFASQGFTPAPFQKQVWKSYASGHNGLLIAPTGAGKTYAMMGAVAQAEIDRPSDTGSLKLLWITPLKALAHDIAAALTTMSDGVGLGWNVELRIGDTSSHIKARQKKKLPEILVTTPESLHVMLSYPGSEKLFAGLQCVVADEWHDIAGSKRGVMLQLALAHLHSPAPQLHVWGISATVGNPDEAMDVLLAAQTRTTELIHDTRRKDLQIETLIPRDIERFPWAGHMGDRQLGEVLDVIMRSRSTLVFTNTRNQSETWYRKLLALEPDLAGQIALHHGSLAQSDRAWVEGALHDGRLKVVICTSSLDLGVDFRPVDTVIQIGSPKGVARFMQRAGRSGHAPGETSRAWFVPTHALELYEAAALKKAVTAGNVEPVEAPRHSLDVLTQWLVTCGAGDGLDIEMVRKEVRRTHAFRDLPDELWNWAVQFVTSGGPALNHYNEYRKLVPGENGRLHTADRNITTRHRLGIGAITSSSSLNVQVLRGSVLGTIDESFGGGLKPGQVFWFSGRALEFIRLRGSTIYVRASKDKRGIAPSWTGGRLPLSSQLADLLRREVSASRHENVSKNGEELQALRPLSRLQSEWSDVPDEHQLLIEHFKDREGHHIVMYPFEGRATHEIMATLMSSRLGVEPNTFSFTYNDYGFELLAANPIDLSEELIRELISSHNLTTDVREAVVAGSLPRRQFRSIAVIAGLVTSGRPGKPQSNRHLQASSETIYDVLTSYDPDNLLLQQAYDEVIAGVIDIERLRITLERVATSEIIITEPPRATPFAFPLIVDRLRERLSTETVGERIKRMQAALEKYAGGYEENLYSEEYGNEDV